MLLDLTINKKNYPFEESFFISIPDLKKWNNGLVGKIFCLHRNFATLGQ